MVDSSDKGTVLVSLARRAIEQELGAGMLVRPSGLAWLDEPGATFVTIEEHGDLRGCIGSIEAVRPLFHDVTKNAVAAALRDPRFTPLKARELETIDLEVSVLSPLTPLQVTSEEDLLRELEPGVHGLLLKLGHRQATFLPSVWEQLPSPREFVAHLKRKGGIPLDHWSEQVEVLVYTVEKFAEKSR